MTRGGRAGGGRSSRPPAISTSSESDLDFYRSAYRGSDIAHTRPERPVDASVAAAEPGCRRLCEVCRVCRELWGGEPKHAAIGQLQCRRQAGADLETIVSDQDEPGVPLAAARLDS